jgi:hypothetical protein
VSAISVLSHGYQTAADLTQAVNIALVVLKKARLGLPGAYEEVESSRRQLMVTIETLISLLTPTATTRPSADPETLARVPSALVSQLQAVHQDDLPYYVLALDQVLSRLRQGVAALTDLDLEQLDQLAAAIDVVASSLFRHLMRA